MKAVVYDNYGSPAGEVLEKPTVADDEVLIKVRAAAINPLDYHFNERRAVSGSHHGRAEQTNGRKLLAWARKKGHSEI